MGSAQTRPGAGAVGGGCGGWITSAIGTWAGFHAPLEATPGGRATGAGRATAGASAAVDAPAKEGFSLCNTQSQGPQNDTSDLQLTTSTGQGHQAKKGQPTQPDRFTYGVALCGTKMRAEARFMGSVLRWPSLEGDEEGDAWATERVPTSIH